MVTLNVAGADAETLPLLTDATIHCESGRTLKGTDEVACVVRVTFCVVLPVIWRLRPI